MHYFQMFIEGLVVCFMFKIGSLLINLAIEALRYVNTKNNN